MDYFTAAEFQGWYGQLSEELKNKVDLFRLHWAAPVSISPAPGAVGRNGGPGDASQHNVDKWGEVRALDIMPSGIDSLADAIRATELAKLCGFRGIGFYPHWRPGPGLHVDTRAGVPMRTPATWGAVRNAEGEQGYVSLQNALEAMR